jgi:hypothetical protein
VIGVLCLAGCGTSHYQAMMAEQQERIEQIDEANKLLDEPLQLPARKSEDKSPARPIVFFRPPKGFSTNPTANERSSILFKYSASAKSNAPFVDIGFAAESLEPDKFWKELLKAFPGAKEASASQVEKAAPGRAKLILKELQHDNYLIYVYPALNPQAAVVFHVDSARRDEASTRKLIDASLGSLAVGQEASRLQRAFKKQSSKH